MKLAISILFLCSLFLLSCTQQIPVEKACTTDADCVPAECCHPTDAVNKDFAPNCAAVLCTASCEPETLDCGQGEIKCLENRCSAIIFEE